MYLQSAGKAYQNNIGYWLCTGGPPMALMSPPLASQSKHKVLKALVARVSVAGGFVLAAIIVFTIWWARRDKRSRENPVAAPIFYEHSSSIDEKEIRDTCIPQSQSMPSPRAYAIGKNTSPGTLTNSSSFLNPKMVPSSLTFPPEIQADSYPRYGNLPIMQTTMSATFEKNATMACQGPDVASTTDNSSFSNSMMVPSSLIFPLEIQSEDYPRHGNLPIKQTTPLALLEKCTVMACQRPEVASNMNTGFYSLVISVSINVQPSSNQIHNTTRVPLNLGISLTMNTESSSNWLYDTVKSPVKQGSEKDG